MRKGENGGREERGGTNFLLCEAREYSPTLFSVPRPVPVPSVSSSGRGFSELKPESALANSKAERLIFPSQLVNPRTPKTAYIAASNVFQTTVCDFSTGDTANIARLFTIRSLRNFLWLNARLSNNHNLRDHRNCF